MGNLIIKTQLLHLIELGITFDVSHDKLQVKGDLTKLDDNSKIFLKSNKSEIISLIQQQRKGVDSVIEARGDDVEKQLSFAQQRLWLLDKIDGGSTQYNMPGALRLTGDLDIDALTKVINTIIERHESLRTYFVEESNGQPLQVIRPFSVADVPITDISLLPEGEREFDLAELVSVEASKPFDLSTDLMLRAQVVKVEAQTHVLLVTMHHIASDGWSMGILINEFSALYSAYVRGEDNPLPALEIQYTDYAHWQRDWLQGEVLDEQLGYWKTQLAGLPVVHSLPLDKPRPKMQTFNGASHHSVIDSRINDKLNGLCQTIGGTLFMGLHAAFSVLLSRYSNETDIVVGSPIANREQAEVADLIGFFVNTLVLRSDLSDNPSFNTLLEQSKKMLLDAYAHQQVPFEQLVETLQPERSLSHSALFQVMLVLQNNEEGSLELPNLTLSPVEQSGGIAKYDLTLNVTESETGLHLDWEYNTDLFNADTIEGLARHFELLLTGLVNTSQESVFSIEMLPPEEVHQQLIDWNDTQADFPKDKCIHQLFEQQAQTNPEAIAVIFEDSQLTYGELNQRANQLAHYLIEERQVTPDTLVGLCVERSLDMIVGIMGILKAGGAYVPLDPSYPTARLAYMLDDAKLTTVLTQDKLKGETPVSDNQAIYLDSEDTLSQLETYSTDNVIIEALTSKHLAYVIYTSGSTGNPKGVMIEHQNIRRLFDASAFGFSFNNKDVWTLFHSFAFDFSVWEVFGALLHGGKLVVVPKEVTQSTDDFWQLLLKERVTVLNQTPSAFTQLISIDIKRQDKLNLRYVVFGGEALHYNALRPWVAKYGCEQPQLINMYGITEATVHVTYRRIFIEDLQLSVDISNIGLPLQDLNVLVLSLQKKLVPIGVAGELYIGGTGLARGYLNQAELTAEKFIPNPFYDTNNPNSSERLYKTGDLVRYLPDGNLAFLGRIDHQVKIRGFRIELGEIEHQLLTHEEVNDAVVVALSNDEGDKRLVAYVTYDEAAAMLVEENDEAQALRHDFIDALKNRLGQKLPDYMVPSAFVVLEQLPLTPSGKVDRKGLPAPDMSLQQKSYVAPTTDTEKLLCEIWQEVLGIEQIGLSDNFFELGGHSLLVMKVIAKAQQAGVSITAKDFFAAPQLSALAHELDKNKDNTLPVFTVPENLIPAECQYITPEMLPLISLTQADIADVAAQVPGGMGNIQDIYPLGPLQEGILYTHMMSDKSDPYVLPMLFEVKGKAVVDGFIDSLEFIINRHDVLRTAFLWEGLSAPVQVVCKKAQLSVAWLDLDEGVDVESHIAELSLPENQWLELTQAPLLTLSIANRDNEGQYFLLLQFHHIISDHVGLEIIQRELSAYSADKLDDLAPTIPYRNFIAHTLHQEKTHDSQGYFTDLLGDIDEPTTPFCLIDIRNDGTQTIELREAVPTKVASGIRELSKSLKLSPASLFHSAFGLVIAACSGKNDVVFGSVMSGRLQGVVGAESMLGVFINTLPLRLNIDGVNVLDFVLNTQQSLHDSLPFEQASLALAQSCSGLTNNTSLFSAMLNYRHSAIGDIDANTSSFGDDSIVVLGGQERTNYPFNLNVDDLGVGFTLDFQVDSSVDIDRVMAYMQMALVQLVDILADTPTQLVSELSVLPAEEVHQQLIAWNDTATDFPKDKCIHELFEQQVKENPEAIAVVFEERQLTYGELNAKANKLAHYLIEERDVTPDTLVGICVDRSLDMIVAIMGILKAGGAYVPLDPSYPAARLAYMLEDANLCTVLTQEKLKDKTPVNESQEVTLDSEEMIAQLQGYSTSNLNIKTLTSNHLAYVIYTSGSTGNPKGVMIEHQQLMNFIVSMQGEFSLDESDSLLAVTSLSFDIHTLEVYLPLVRGSQLVVASLEGAANPHYLSGLIEKYAVSIMQATPSTWKMLVGDGWKVKHAFKALSGGEALSGDLKNALLSRKNVELWNMYGPTETCVWSLVAKMRYVQSVNIGQPISNTQLYLLADDLSVAPIGVQGELHIGGAGLARGYLNRDDLTAEKFIANPFFDKTDPNSSKRLYKTGDLVRYLPDGNLEFLGRIDHQVKIRGFRIELSEIEHQLLSHGDVNDAVVVALSSEDGDKRLVAYVTHDNAAAMIAEDELDDEAQTLRHNFIDSLKAKLGQDLPDYMVPSVFVVLEHLPLTPNGKLDRKGLPSPDMSLQQKVYVAPTTETEKLLCEIWQEVLGIERVGITDNFFELGGHSLLVVKLIAQVNKSMNVIVELAKLFELIDISRLSIYIESLLARQKNEQLKLVKKDELEIEW